MLTWQQKLLAKGYNIILASASPRRKELLGSIFPEFTIRVIETDESYPSALPAEQVAGYIAFKKAKAFEGKILANEIIITADTTVIINNKILGKPTNFSEALSMLIELNGSTHLVQTAYCISTSNKLHTFTDTATVTFCKLEEEEIAYYINTHKPFDKAGAYGIQDWLGIIGISKLEGSYFTVMGLPTQPLYSDLKTLSLTLPELNSAIPNT